MARYRKINNKKVMRGLIYIIFLPLIVGCLLIGEILRAIKKRSRFSKNKLEKANHLRISRNHLENNNYSAKNYLMTDCEKEFFETINSILQGNYILQPQINLASVIEKESFEKYRNELFRNIDFGVFDKDYKLLLLIEINDQTHQEKKRQERDRKVKMICQKAGIPLIVFWTKFGCDRGYIFKRLAEYLPLLQT